MTEIIQKMDELIDKLSDIADAIDCVYARPAYFWMVSDIAAIDQAKAMGVVIQPEWSINDLRYKLHQAISGGS